MNSSLNRCAICDYVSGFGSDYILKGVGHNAVHYRPKLNEYLCTDCMREVLHQKQYFKDVDNGFQRGFAQSKAPEGTPAVPVRGKQ